jgi:methionyl-tRNA synthetase
MSHDEFPTDRPAVVTCGLPYANGDLHVGHLRGYVGADTLNRALRKTGQQTAYVCGSDMHGTPIAVNAAKEGVSPEEFALSYHEQYEETFPRFNVEFDNYGHTHDETNTELTKEIVRALEAGGYVYQKAIQVGYDPEADQYLPDRYVEGTCPYCGEKARGDECDEGCGRHLEPGEVENPVSVLTGNPAEYREREHRFFRVSELQEYLQGFIDRLEGTSNAQNQPREWIEGELQDWCITRDMDWGIDYPTADGDEGPEDLVLYVWVDAPIEYVSSTKQYSESVGAGAYAWEEVWRPDETDGSTPDSAGGGGEVIHVIGRDIIQHHTVFWPAMLHAAGYTEPRAVAATGFITINGKGLSTSRNRAIWAKEYLDEGFHPDLLRFYLTTNGGLQQDVDFSWAKFQERVDNELVGTLGNFLYRSLLFAQREFGGTPEADVSARVEERIESAVADFRAGVNDYSVRQVGTAAIELARFGNEYIQNEEPWNLTDEDPERAAQVIRDCVQLAKAVVVLFEPIAPGKAEDLWQVFGGDDRAVDEVALDAAHEPPAAAFDAPTEPFEKVEDDRVAELTEKLEARIEATASDDAEGDEETETDERAGADASDMEPLLEDRISFGEFQELDLRVGRIESAEPIEGADKLLRLEVDIGHEVRQVVAGLRQLHDHEELPGTKLVVVTNLEKAELFGTESNGMVLAAGEQADLLTTHGDSEPGTRVR